jgi:hypothetical protein
MQPVMSDVILLKFSFVPHTKPIAYVPSWSVDGIISTMKHLPSMVKVYISAGLFFQRIAVTCISGA